MTNYELILKGNLKQTLTSHHPQKNYISSVIQLQVMIQKQNRHMSMSLYLATLAVTDTIVLASGKKACQHMQMEKKGEIYR